MTAGARAAAAAVAERRTGGWSVIGAAVAVAVASLALPAALSFDPWAWLVWGRETTRLALDTTGGPSWKPLPVLITTLTAPFGASAAALWMLVARAGAILALVGAYRLATRFAGAGAGVLAAALLLLTPDGDPRFLRLVGEGHVAPLTATFALFAVEFHLGDRPLRVLGLGWCAALLRPEAWPFVALYALWIWFRRPRHRGLVALTLVGIPTLWFGGDWWGSGDPLQGADTAQVSAHLSVFERFRQAVEVAASIVVAPAWVAAGLALWSARRRRERALWAMAAGGAIWSGLVIVMATALGYAALSRFHLPVAALACVLAGIGAARGLGALRRAGRPVLAGVAVIASVVALVPRASGVVPVLEEVAERGQVEHDLDRVIALSGGSVALASCGEVAVEGTGLLRSAVPWKLDLPLRLSPRQLSDGTGTLLLRAGKSRDRTVSTSPLAVELARTEEWVAYAVRCPSAGPHG